MDDRFTNSSVSMLRAMVFPANLGLPVLQLATLAGRRLPRQTEMASSPAVSKLSAADHQQNFETQLKALFRIAPCFGKNGFGRGVDEETAKKLAQSIVAEYNAKHASYSNEDLSFLFQTATEQVKQLAKQVI